MKVKVKINSILYQTDKNNLDKASLRNILKIKCQSLSQIERGSASLSAAKIFAESPLFLTGVNFSLYLAQSYEFNVQAIAELLWETNKNVFLPALPDIAIKEMQFKKYMPNTELQKNRYDILEPKGTEYLPAPQLDIVFMPLLGFDLQGFRIGKGGGYYDATFSFMQTQPRPIKPQLIGVGYEAQFVEGDIPHDEWDVPLDGVLTEEQLIFFNRL